MRYSTLAVIVLAGVSASQSRAAKVIFNRIADTRTAIPNGTGGFQLFGPTSSQALPPSVSGDNVAFIASGPSLQEGVYLGKPGGSLTRVADRKTPTPGGAGNLTDFQSVAVDGANVAFNGDSNGATFVVGIYKNVGAGLVKVADTSGGGGFSRPDIVGRDVYVFYDGPGVANESIVTDAGGSLHTLVTDGVPTPGGTGVLQSLNSNVAAANGAVAFFGVSGAQRGIYLYRNGTLSKVADTHTLTPDRTGNFQAFSNGNIAFDGTDVLFSATDAAGVSGLYRTRDGELVNVVNSNTIVSGYGKLSLGDINNIPMVIDGDNVAFANGNAIFYSDPDGSIQKLIGAGDRLLGKPVVGLTFGTEGLSGDEIAFGARFIDGTSGIYLATVPLPPGAFAAMPLAAWILHRARRGKRA
jgi:hypothetical protein